MAVNLYHGYDSAYKAWPDTTLERVRAPVSRVIKVSRSAINLKAVVFIRFCTADNLSRQGSPIRHKKRYKNINFQNDGASRYSGDDSLIHLLI